MAKDEELKLDPFEFDGDMDFNFNEEMSGGINQEINMPKNRHPILNAIIGGAKGTGDYLTDPQNYKDVLKRSLPSTYGDIAGGISDATTGIHELYDQTFKELNPRLNSIIKKLDSIVPESMSTTKKLLEKADSATGGYKVSDYDRAAADEQNVNNILTGVFGAQAESDKADEVKQIVRDKMEVDRHRQSMAVSDTMRRDISALTQYTTTVTQAYQRKSLELQIRSFMLQQEYSAASLDYMKKFEIQHEAITKNTALPEYVKISKSELFEQRLATKVMDTLFGDSTFLSRGFTRLKKTAGDFVQGISRGLSMVDANLEQGIDAKNQMDEMRSMAAEVGMDTNDLSAASMLGSNLAAFGLDMLKDKAIDKLKPWADENDNLKERLAEYSKWATNPEGKLAEFRNRDDWKEKKDLPGWQGMLANAVDIALGSFADEDPQRDFKSGNVGEDLNSPAEGFTKRASVSVTTVIPGFLARIEREIAMMRTGNVAPLFTYDYSRGEFIKSDAMRDRIMDTLKSKRDQSIMGYRLKSAEDDLLGDSMATEEERAVLRSFLLNLAQEKDLSLDDIEKIRETDSYQYSPKRIQEIIEERFKAMEDSGFHQKSASFIKKIKSVKTSIPSLNVELKKYIDAGYGPMLEKEGLIKLNEAGTEYEVDELSFRQFLEESDVFKDTYTSDVNTKTNIKPTSPSGVLRRLDEKSSSMVDWGAPKGSMVNKKAYEGFKKTKLFNWKYKLGQGDEGIHDGPMAQDVKANLGEEAAPNGKAIDIQSVTGSFFSAVKYLGERLDNLFSKKEEKEEKEAGSKDEHSSSSILTQIADNTAATAAMLKEQLELIQKGGGVGGTGGRTLYGDIRQLFAGRDLKGMKDKAYEKAGLAGKMMKSGLLFVDKVLGTSANLTGIGKGSSTLSSHNLLHIRVIQQGATLKNKYGDLCRKLLDQYPEYKDTDTSDKAIDAARAQDDLQEEQPQDERTVMQLFGSIAKNLMVTIAGIGTAAFRVGKAGFYMAKDNIVKPGFTMAVNGTKHILSLLEDKTGGHRKTKRYTGNDLISIRALITSSKIEGPRGIPAREMLKLYPEFLELDTSDEAIEKANNDPTIQEEQDPLDRTILSYVDSIVSNVGRMAFRVGANIITDKIPAAFRGLNAIKDKAIDLASKFINRVEDLYLAGQQNPVIRAKLLELGKYRDQATGKILRTIDDIKAIKGNIIDEDGNVVLTLDEISKGLFNKTGEEIKTTVMKGLTKAKDFVVGGLNKLGGFLTGGVQFGDSKHMKETSEAAVDIRDILLGDIDKVRERLSRRATGTGFGEGGGGSTSVVEVDADGADAKDKSETTPSTVNAPDAFRGLGRLKDKVTNALTPENKAKLLDAKDKVKGRFTENVDKLKGFFAKKEGTSSSIAPVTIVPGSKSGIDWGAKKGNMFQGKTTEHVDYARPEDEADKALASGNKYRQTQEAAKPSRYSRTKAPELIGPLPATVPETRAGKLLGVGKGLLSKAGGALSGAASLAGSLLGGSNAEDKPVDNKAQEAADAAHKDDYTEVKARKSKVKGVVSAKDRAWNDKDGDGERDGGVDDRLDKLEALKKARTKETLKADLSLRYKSGSNVLDKMMEMAGKFLGNITGIIGSVTGAAGTLLSKIPGLSKIGSAISGALSGKGILSTVARTAWTATKFMGGLGGRALMALGGLGINAVTATGATLISAIAAPVLIGAAVVGVGYGLYKLYQHAKRNNANEYERLRLRQYGFAFNNVVDAQNHRIYTLEAYLEDSRVGFNASKEAYLLDKKIKPEEMLEVFGINAKDEERTKLFTEWFKVRFKPIFLAHQTALMRQDNKAKLADVYKLKPQQRLAYLEATKVSSDLYRFDLSPVESIDSLNCDVDEINESFSRLIEKDRIEADKAAKASPLPEKAKVDASTNKQADAAKQAEINNPADKAQQAIAERQNAQRLTSGEGDGVKNPNTTGMTNLPTTYKNNAGLPQPLKSATGPMLNGDGGMQFINRNKDVNLEGLSPALLRNFLGMAEEYGKLTGKSINVNDGRRTTEEQASLYRKYPGKAAKPGRSLHEFGLAVDINSSDAEELERLGLMKKYGFTRPVGQEPWHVEPAGIQSSLDTAKRGGQIAEAMVATSIGHGGGGYGTLPNAEKYRRNGPLAAQLFAAKGTAVDPEADKAVVAKANSAATTEAKVEAQYKPPEDLRSETKIAANDSSFEKTAKQSKAQQVPNVPNTEGESKPTVASAASKGKEDVIAVLDKSAKRVGVDPNIVKAIAAVESDMNPNAKARTSSAAGLMQVTRGTWNELMSKHGSKYNLDPNTPPTDPEAAALLGSENIKSNNRVLSSVKPNPTATDNYLAYFLGVGGAKKFLQYSPDVPAAQNMQDAAAANRNIFFDPSGRQLTFGEIYQKLGNKIQSKASAYGISIQAGEGLKLKPESEQGTGLKAGSSRTLSSMAANDASMVEPQTTVPQPVQAQSRSRAPTPAFNLDNRSPAYQGTGRNESGQSTTQITTAKLETLTTESIDIQKKSLETLTTIASSLSSEELIRVFATALKAMPQPEAKENTPKEKDEINMGRTIKSSGPSIDLRRRSA